MKSTLHYRVEKWTLLILLIAFLGLFASLSTLLKTPSVDASAQKQRFAQVNLEANCAAQDLDCSTSFAVGKRGFYVPTFGEGCDTTAPQGCKFPAVITGINSTFNASTGRFQTVRDSNGHVLVSIHVDRPAFKGGSFDKDNVAFADGCQGCFRTVQQGDLVGF
jgi:hypothetical protein